MDNEKKTLIINTGSSSKRYSLYFGNRLEVLGHFKLEDGKFLTSITHEGKTVEYDIQGELTENFATKFISKLKEEKIVSDDYKIDFIGIRIVAPGDYFTEDRIIDDEYIKKLLDIEKSAPLHIKPIIKEIKSLKETFGDVKMFGISDSKFHKDIGKAFKIYSLPRSDTEEAEVYRFGYHGLSVKSVLDNMESITGPVQGKIIVCHLGSGVSVTAVKDKKSFNTSMGFTPLEGLTMRTRVGNIDPGALIHLAKTKGFSFDDLENYLNTECGLFGLSGIRDIREIIEVSSNNNELATTALNIFVNDVKEYIGSYSALMNGLDFLVFTGAIGERSDVVRERICSEMGYFGINLDREKNRDSIGKDGVISKDGSKTKIVVVRSDEMKEMLSVINKFTL